MSFCKFTNFSMKQWKVVRGTRHWYLFFFFFFTNGMKTRKLTSPTTLQIINHQVALFTWLLDDYEEKFFEVLQLFLFIYNDGRKISGTIHSGEKKKLIENSMSLKIDLLWKTWMIKLLVPIYCPQVSLIFFFIRISFSPELFFLFRYLPIYFIQRFWKIWKTFER